MSLDFGFNSSGLFNTSNEAGYGLGANNNQQVINDGDIFNRWYDNVIGYWETWDNLTAWTETDCSVNSNRLVLNAGAATISSDVPIAVSDYTFKSGKLYFNGLYSMDTSGCHVYLKIEIGNDTDGWTEVGSLGFEDADINSLPFNFECIYTGGNNWDAYFNGNATTDTNLPNGMKLKIFYHFVTGGGFYSFSGTDNSFINKIKAVTN